MIEPEQTGPCRKCKDLLDFVKENRKPTYMTGIGQAVRYRKRLESGITTTSRFFQCPQCGQLWQEVEDVAFEDNGSGGRRRYLYFLEIIR